MRKTHLENSLMHTSCLSSIVIRQLLRFKITLAYRNFFLNIYRAAFVAVFDAGFNSLPNMNPIYQFLYFRVQ